MKVLRRAVLASMAVVALVLAAPGGVALAAPDSAPRAVHTRGCTSSGLVISKAANLPIRYAPNIGSTVFFVVQKNDVLPCWDSPPVTVDGRYTACGVSQANGWIEVYTGNDWGFTYQTCLLDYFG
ncbi:hypothetical protein GCM10022225_80280 [Plantactinospora mayteni]|uniref:SH3 domain-containing protein n=1 Tax=Plantactinospora mayteni TaxID=566021 RepID=A0ABQ4F3B1_9ACTN|nr:hypothetical protein [Plantactinospora mayteni]GIH01377.1 hypothetical protein Pma05_79490 [Plantactinospora mayteni]